MIGKYLLACFPKEIPNALNKSVLFDLLLSTCLINILGLALPLTMMQIYDRIIVNASYGTLFWISSGCVIAFFMESMLKLLRHHITNWSASRYEKNSSTWLLNKLLFGKIDRSINLSVPLNLERIQALSQLKGFYSGQLFQTLLDFPFIFIFLLVVFLINKALAAILILVITAYFAMVYLQKKIFKSYKNEQDEHNRKRHDFILNTLEKLHLIKTLSLEERILRRYENHQSLCAQTNIISNFWTELPSISGAFFGQLALFALLSFGAWLVINGSMTIGGLTATMIITGRVMQPVQNIGSLWLRFSEIEHANKKLEPIRQINEIEHLSSTNNEALTAKEILGHLVLSNVSFAYNKTSIHLKEISIELRPKTFTIIDKNSSSGATTLLLLMAQLTSPTTGELFLDNIPLKRFSNDELRGIIEYVPTQGILFKGTVRDNITMFDPRSNAFLDAATMLGLDDWVAELPMGYETPVDSHSNKLFPRGAIQRLIIARALVFRPRILLLDYPDHSMDLESLEYFKWLLRKLKGNCTIVLATKNVNLFNFADQIVTIENGKVLSRGRE